MMKLKLTGSMKMEQQLLALTPKKVLFITGDWNAKVESRKIPRIIRKFG